MSWLEQRSPAVGSRKVPCCSGVSPQKAQAKETKRSEFNPDAAQYERAHLKCEFAHFQQSRSDSKADWTAAATLDVTVRAQFENQSSDLSSSIDVLTRATSATKKAMRGKSLGQSFRQVGVGASQLSGLVTTSDPGNVLSFLLGESSDGRCFVAQNDCWHLEAVEKDATRAELKAAMGRKTIHQGHTKALVDEISVLNTFMEDNMGWQSDLAVEAERMKSEPRQKFKKTSMITRISQHGASMKRATWFFAGKTEQTEKSDLKNTCSCCRVLLTRLCGRMWATLQDVSRHWRLIRRQPQPPARRNTETSKLLRKSP